MASDGCVTCYLTRGWHRMITRSASSGQPGIDDEATCQVSRRGHNGRAGGPHHAPYGGTTVDQVNPKTYGTSAGLTTRSSRPEIWAASAVDSTCRCSSAVSRDGRPSRTASMKSRVARMKDSSHSDATSS